MMTRALNLVLSMTALWVLWSTGPALAQSGSTEQDDAERREVEAWVKADIERALRFYQDVRPMHVSMIVRTEVPASAEQAAARLERLAALARQIEGKPEHPLRSEYVHLLHYAPGGSMQAESHLWIGSVNGRLAWRESGTLHSDALDWSSLAHDSGVCGSVEWRYAYYNGSITLTDYPPPLTPEGLRIGYLATWEDVLLGWATTPERDGHHSTTVTRQPSDQEFEQRPHSTWRADYVFKGMDRSYSIAWDKNSQNGFVTGRHTTGRSGSQVVRRLAPAARSMGGPSIPERVFIDRYDAQGTPLSVTTCEHIVVEDMEEDAFLNAVCVPASSHDDGSPTEQEDVLRNRPRGRAINVDDRRTRSRVGATQLWTVGLRDAVMGGATYRSATASAPAASNVPSTLGVLSQSEHAVAIGLVGAFGALCFGRLCVACGKAKEKT